MPIGNATGPHVSTGAKQMEEPAFTTSEDRISEILQRKPSPGDASASREHLQKLREEFESVPTEDAKKLLERLKQHDKGDPLSALFHEKLSPEFRLLFKQILHKKIPDVASSNRQSLDRMKEHATGRMKEQSIQANVLQHQLKDQLEGTRIARVGPGMGDVHAAEAKRDAVLKAEAEKHAEKISRITPHDPEKLNDYLQNLMRQDPERFARLLPLIHRNLGGSQLDGFQAGIDRLLREGSHSPNAAAFKAFTNTLFQTTDTPFAKTLASAILERAGSYIEDDTAQQFVAKVALRDPSTFKELMEIGSPTVTDGILAISKQEPQLVAQALVNFKKDKNPEAFNSLLAVMVKDQASIELLSKMRAPGLDAIKADIVSSLTKDIVANANWAERIESTQPFENNKGKYETISRMLEDPSVLDFMARTKQGRIDVHDALYAMMKDDWSKEAKSARETILKQGVEHFAAEAGKALQSGDAVNGKAMVRNLGMFLGIAKSAMLNSHLDRAEVAQQIQTMLGGALDVLGELDSLSHPGFQVAKEAMKAALDEYADYVRNGKDAELKDFEQKSIDLFQKIFDQIASDPNSTKHIEERREYVDLIMNAINNWTKYDIKEKN